MTARTSPGLEVAGPVAAHGFLAGANLEVDPDVDRPDAIPHPREFWHCPPQRNIPDAHGYGRIPAFWFTLNLPFNYLFEVHRFQHAVAELAGQPCADDVVHVDCLDSVSREAMGVRCDWVVNNPDIVVTLHAIRVDLMLQYVMRHIVPEDENNPFLYLHIN